MRRDGAIEEWWRAGGSDGSVLVGERKRKRTDGKVDG